MSRPRSRVLLPAREQPTHSRVNSEFDPSCVKEIWIVPPITGYRVFLRAFLQRPTKTKYPDVLRSVGQKRRFTPVLRSTRRINPSAGHFLTVPCPVAAVANLPAPSVQLTAVHRHARLLVNPRYCRFNFLKGPRIADSAREQPTPSGNTHERSHECCTKPGES